MSSPVESCLHGHDSFPDYSSVVTPGGQLLTYETAFVETHYKQKTRTVGTHKMLLLTCLLFVL